MFGASEKLDRALGVITDFHGDQVPDAHTDGWLGVASKGTQRGSLALPLVPGYVAEMDMTHAFLFLRHGGSSYLHLPLGPLRRRGLALLS